MTTRRADPPTPRPRSHPTLAPAHLGEAASVATLAAGIFGIAFVITGVAMLVSGMTLGNRYAGAEAPPDLVSLGLGTILGGAGILILGGGLMTGTVAVLAGVRRARWATGALALLGAGLAAAGTVIAMTAPPAAPLIATALTVVTLVLGVSGILLIRPAR